MSKVQVTKVHCQACNKVGRRTKDFTCSHCNSEDVFTAHDYVRDQIIDIEESRMTDFKSKQVRLAMWNFVFDELTRES